MMDKNTLIAKTHELQASPSCYAGLKEAGQNWIDAIGTPGERKAAENFVAELEADILPIDAVISFMQSDAAAAHFGAEQAAGIAAHAQEVQAAGGKYCDCPACAAGLAILDSREVLLG